MSKFYIKEKDSYIEYSRIGKKSNDVWSVGDVSSIFIKQNGSWVTSSTITSTSTSYVYGGHIASTFTIMGPESVTAATCSLVAMCGTDNVTSSSTWTITSGNEYATISSGGVITISTAATASQITVQSTYAGLSDTKNIVLTYNAQTPSETEVVVTTDESGNTVVIETVVTNNQDGSYNSETTTYNEDGDPVKGESSTGDTHGNVSTQGVSYDESGNTTVTSYTIDTSENPGGEKTFNVDGVNTEYYAFDMTEGFVVDMHFTIDFANQPAGQDENHHNILTAKRANPSPWYGFQLRQTSTAKTITLGTQFSTGSNTNTSLSPASTTGNVGEYNLKIIYDPTASTDKFKCINANNGTVLYRSNGVFPDLEALKYIKVTIGYAMDTNGDPFRYSNINVSNFSIKKLKKVEAPVITYEENVVTITCSTAGATIHYRTAITDSYSVYTAAVPITADCVVYAYAELNDDMSDIVSKNCIYEPGVAEPSITCDGEFVTIICEDTGATIYYDMDESGTFSAYTTPIAITADTLISSYAEVDGVSSRTVTQNCIYNPGHDYPREYLTLRVSSGGTLVWNAIDGVVPKVIQYSINNGAWVTVTASSSSTIAVNDGDVVRLKGTNSPYASSNSAYCGFDGSTAYFDVEGNIMSLVYGDNFIGNTGLTGSYNFCSIFKNSNVVSAENLILPATTLTPHCYRAMFAQCSKLAVAPELPATTLAEGCYRFMFQDAVITTAPDLPVKTLVTDCYDGMFNNCRRLNYIRCLATDLTPASATSNWVHSVAGSGTFVKAANVEWTIGASGIPTNWVVIEEGLVKPTVNCDGLSITLECPTQGATIYYRLNESGTYSAYTAPIPITADTVVEAYSELDSETSDIVKETCIYDDGITEPAIYCDGEFVTMSCDTGGASIYYRMNQVGTYTQYEEAIAITADTIFEAYSEIDGRMSEIVSANCIYDDSMKAPVIDCDGEEVTISCRTANADVYYRLNEEGTYSSYTAPFSITADTIVEAYSERSGETSSIVSKNCIYNPTHDYSKDYLTLKVTNGGTIAWNSIGTGQSKTVEYSVNNGTWTSITASTSTTIPVVTGDEVRFRGTNTTYAKDKSNYSGFEGGTAYFDIEGNIMSLVYGDNFENQTALTSTYNFCSMFKLSNCVSAENLVLPTTTLTQYCYRAMFSKCYNLAIAPELPAMTLAQGCYWYMFEECAITTAPDLLAETLVRECYGHMFTGCTSLNYIKCMAITGFNQTNCKQNWVANVAPSGTFVKDSSVSVTTWSRGNNGIPTNWLVYDDVSVIAPVITCDGYNNVTITCDTVGADIYYRLDGEGSYSAYTTAITITADTVVEAYSELSGQESRVVSQTCQYISDDPYEASNRNLYKWNYNNVEVTTPYSVNQLDGHSSSYAKGTFNFETSFALREAQPTYLWFQHADQSATVYIDNTLVEKHWGGYISFFVDVTNYVHSGTNVVKVALKNNEGNYLAPAAGDFNFNATLGNVKLYTSPYLPAMNYGYDGFHITSTVSDAEATMYIKTNVPTGATLVCTIDDGNTNIFSATSASTGAEMTFTKVISNPHLWNGLSDPYLYTVTLEIYHNNELYHRYVRPYGLRYYEYVINDTVKYGTEGSPYTGFLLNGSPYLLRGVCMHDDIDGKANALNDADYTTTFATIQELGCNFIRLAHYPHPRETYDWCDRLGIVVQTEGPCVNKMQSTMPTDYYDHLNGQYDDMVNQHYNHPCIMFWGLSNETTTDDKSFAHDKIEGYISRIRALDSERMIGYVMAQGASDPSAYYNNPSADWFGCNIYEGWYSNQNSNNPSGTINTRIKNIITNKSKAMAYSEYGCGGTQRCHSDDFMTTTTRGNNPRHDIEYMMWLHEGHIAAIKNYPQLLFTSQWQLFDIAVANRNEGYTVCLDGENATTDDSLRRLNNKGLVERDHVTKKDTFYLYKAWWNPQKFVHICCKNYTKMTNRTIKCYSNDGDSLSLYVNDTFIETASISNNIVTFTSMNFSSGDVVRVQGENTSDTFTFGS